MKKKHRWYRVRYRILDPDAPVKEMTTKVYSTDSIHASILVYGMNRKRDIKVFSAVPIKEGEK